MTENAIGCNYLATRLSGALAAACGAHDLEGIKSTNVNAARTSNILVTIVAFAADGSTFGFVMAFNEAVFKEADTRLIF